MTHPIKALGLLSGFCVLLAMAADAQQFTTRDAVPPSTVVAQINGKPVPYSDLVPAVQTKLDKMQREHDAQVRDLDLATARQRAEFQEAELQRLIDQRVLQLEGTKLRKSPEELLGSIEGSPVTDAQVRALYDSQQTQIGKPFEAVESQIRGVLQRQGSEEAQLKYLSSLREKYKVALEWEPLRESVADSGPVRGPGDALVTIVEFSDFQCPFCGRMAPVFRDILKQYPTQVRLVFRNLPLTSVHPDAAKAAEAGVCAKNQGKFWEMHDILYAEQSSLSVNALKDKARRIGLDTQQFDDCLDSGAGHAAVLADEKASSELGLDTTPTSFVNGRYVSGVMPMFKWRTLIDEEIRRTPKRPVSAASGP